jgi:hypothetical protein
MDNIDAVHGCSSIVTDDAKRPFVLLISKVAHNSDR